MSQRYRRSSAAIQDQGRKAKGLRRSRGEIGAEGEDDLSQITSDIAAQAVVGGTDWTIETILNQLRRGNIDIDPSFQRRDAWRKVRKSRFIESLLLGFPVPQIVLAERREKRGSYIVLDGKQRLLSLWQFATPPDTEGITTLYLQGLENRSDLNGKCLLDLQADPIGRADVDSFDNQTIRTVVVRNWPNESFLYSVFLRLNTGSVQLSPQELRQALHPGRFLEFCDEYTVTNATLRPLLNITGPDFRMRDVELLVRYFAFKYFLGHYAGNLKEFLDFCCQRLNTVWDRIHPRLVRSVKRLESAIQTTNQIFSDDHAFQVFSGQYEGRFNRTVFDIMAFYFSRPSVARASTKRARAVKRAFENLCESDATFSQSLVITTKSIPATFTRLSTWGETLRRVTKVEVPRLSLLNNRIVVQKP